MEEQLAGWRASSAKAAQENASLRTLLEQCQEEIATSLKDAQAIEAERERQEIVKLEELVDKTSKQALEYKALEKVATETTEQLARQSEQREREIVYLLQTVTELVEHATSCAHRQNDSQESWIATFQQEADEQKRSWKSLYFLEMEENKLAADEARAQLDQAEERAALLVAELEQLNPSNRVNSDEALGKSQASQQAEGELAAVQARLADSVAAQSELEARLEAAEQATRRVSRVAALRRVYGLFDLERSGDVGEAEMMELGLARRRLGQAEGEWTVESNRALVEQIGLDERGKIPEDRFVSFFVDRLVEDPGQFEQTMCQFSECARECSNSKISDQTTNQQELDSAQQLHMRLLQAELEAAQQHEANAVDAMAVEGRELLEEVQLQAQHLVEGEVALQYQMEETKRVALKVDELGGSLEAEQRLRLEAEEELERMRQEVELLQTSNAVMQNELLEVRAVRSKLSSGSRDRRSPTSKQQTAQSGSQPHLQPGEESRKPSTGLPASQFTPKCQEYLAGSCQYGDKCVFLHEADNEAEAISALIFEHKQQRHQAELEAKQAKDECDALRKKLQEMQETETPKDTALEGVPAAERLVELGFSVLPQQQQSGHRQLEQEPTAEVNTSPSSDGADMHPDLPAVRALKHELAANQARTEAETRAQQAEGELAAVQARLADSVAAQSELEARLEAAEQATRRVSRVAALRRVYGLFDLERSGDVGEAEMMELGLARRRLGQAEGEWTVESNRALVEQIGLDERGKIPEDRFVSFFVDRLVEDPGQFEQTMCQFSECARECSNSKMSHHEQSLRTEVQQEKDEAEEVLRRLLSEHATVQKELDESQTAYKRDLADFESLKEEAKRTAVDLASAQQQLIEVSDANEMGKLEAKGHQDANNLLRAMMLEEQKQKEEAEKEAEEEIERSRAIKTMMQEERQARKQAEDELKKVHNELDALRKSQVQVDGDQPQTNAGLDGQDVISDADLGARQHAEEETKRLSAEHAEAKEALEQASVAHKEELGQAQAELRALQAKLDASVRQENGSSHDAEAFKTQIAEEQSLRQASEKKVERLEIQHAVLESDHGALKSELQDVHAELRLKSEALIALTLQDSQLKKASDKAKYLEQERAMLQRELDRLRAEAQRRPEVKQEQTTGEPESRDGALCQVFRLFDLDNNGSIGEQELFQLGQARRAMGQRGGEWTGR